MCVCEPASVCQYIVCVYIVFSRTSLPDFPIWAEWEIAGAAGNQFGRSVGRPGPNGQFTQLSPSLTRNRCKHATPFAPDAWRCCAGVSPEWRSASGPRRTRTQTPRGPSSSPTRVAESKRTTRGKKGELPLLDVRALIKAPGARSSGKKNLRGGGWSGGVR